MARRKDHSPEQLKALILSAAKKLIEMKGMDALTARAVARHIGYTPGTIYNFYRDMDALVTDINFETLGFLHAFCRGRIEGMPPTFQKVRALAYAYVDFAHENSRAWETIFSTARKGEKKTRLPKHYQERLMSLFSLIEATLCECLQMNHKEAQLASRLLWSCLHGITVLTLDGRLSLIGIDHPHDMIDDLLNHYLAAFFK